MPCLSEQLNFEGVFTFEGMDNQINLVCDEKLLQFFRPQVFGSELAQWRHLVQISGGVAGEDLELKARAGGL